MTRLFTDHDPHVPAAIRKAIREGRVVDDLSILDDRRGEDPGRRNGDNDGRSRMDGWLRVLIPIALAALVAYFTAISAVQQNVAQVKTTEQDHFEEILRRLVRIETWQDRQDEAARGGHSR